MALNIKTVKISFSRIGITTSNTPRRVCYLPMATIKYIDAKKKQKQEFLTGASLGDMRRFNYQMQLNWFHRASDKKAVRELGSLVSFEVCY